MSRISAPAERRRRLVTRTLPIGAVALAAFVTGMIAGSGSSDLDGARRFVAAWQQGDFAAMYAELSPAATARYPLAEFTSEYERAARTATLNAIDPGQVSRGRAVGGGAAAVVALGLQTNAFGQLDGTLVLPLSGGKIEWDPTLVFPGLSGASTSLGAPACQPARRFWPATGPPWRRGPATARSSPLGSAAPAVAGVVGAPDAAQAVELEALGYPAGSLTGISGLELAFNDRLAGRPGGELLAQGGAGGQRALAESQPQPGKPVHTTIDPSLQSAAVADLGATYGGVAAIDARTGQIRAVAGWRSRRLSPLARPSS